MLSVHRSTVAWLLAALSVASLVDRSLAEWVALGLIVLAGIPHGAFDVRVAQQRWGSSTPARIGIILGYLLSGLAMSAVCLVWPLLGLGLFLAISVLHFGEGERRVLGFLPGYLVGCAVIALPIALHPESATGYLSFFVSADQFSVTLPYLRIVAGAMILISLLFCCSQILRGRSAYHAWELLLCLVAMLTLSPLAGFAVWFIGRHSAQHLALCQKVFTGGSYRLGWDFVVISAAAILLIIPLWAWFDLTQIEQLFAASIILIAGLTLPHMVVTHAAFDS